MENADDKELVALYLAGEEEALPILIKRKIKIVYRFVFGLVGDEFAAEDITQEVFTKMWRKLGSYKSKYAFNTWLLTIARNTATDYLRKKKELVFSDFDNAEGDNVLTDTLTDELPRADEIFDQAFEEKELKLALKKLPLIYREVLVLRYTNDLSFDEISTVLKRPLETVKSQHRRGLLHLKALVKRIN